MIEGIDFANLMLYVIVVIGIIGVIAYVIDLKAIPQKRPDGKMVLKKGYYAKFKVILIPFVLSSFIGGVINSVEQEDEMWLLLIIFSLFILLILIYSILEILNFKIVFDKEEITKHNVLGNKTTIHFDNLSNLNKNFLGIGTDLIFTDYNGDTITVKSDLPGYIFFKKYIEKLGLQIGQ